MEVVLYFVHGPRPFFWKGQGPGIPPLGLPVQAFPLEKETSGRNADEFENFFDSTPKTDPRLRILQSEAQRKGASGKNKKVFQKTPVSEKSFRNLPTKKQNTQPNIKETTTMKKMNRKSILTLTAAVALTAMTAFGSLSAMAASLNMDDALQIVAQYLNRDASELKIIEQEYDDGKYEFDFILDDVKYEFEVGASSGKILKMEQERADREDYYEYEHRR